MPVTTSFDAANYLDTEEGICRYCGGARMR